MAHSRRGFLGTANGALFGLSMGWRTSASAQTMTPPVAASFARIMNWTDANLPVFRQSLRPGASADALQRLETLIGQALPQDVHELYRLADGQIPFDFGKTPYYPGLFLGIRFNPTEVIANDWWSIEQALKRIDVNEDESLSSFPFGAVKAIHYSKGWIPLSDDGGGNHLAIDLDPGPAGSAGQLITYGPDEFERLRVASSLAAFLHWVAGEMEAGRFAAAQGEEYEMSPLDLEAFKAGELVAVSGPPSEDDWRWRNIPHLHDGLRAYLKDGGQIG